MNEQSSDQMWMRTWKLTTTKKIWSDALQSLSRTGLPFARKRGDFPPENSTLVAGGNVRGERVGIFVCVRSGGGWRQSAGRRAREVFRPVSKPHPPTGVRRGHRPGLFTFRRVVDGGPIGWREPSGSRAFCPLVPSRLQRSVTIGIVILH